MCKKKCNFVLSNETTHNMTEILKYTIPALFVLLATWIVLHKMMQQEEQKRLWEMKKATQKEITPVRLRGYERLALLLERTTPEHMIAEQDVTSMTVLELQSVLVGIVRQEYDHNLSQQIYVSDETWAMIIAAKEETIRFINTIAQQHKPDENALTYAQNLITIYAGNGDTPTQNALQILKEEARNLFV